MKRLYSQYPMGKEMNRIKEEFRVPEDFHNIKNWKKELKKAWDAWEEIQIEEKKNSSRTLKYINNAAINRRAWNVDGTENGKWLSRLKLGDLGK